MRLFELLEVKQKKRNAFQKSEEFQFFVEHRYLLGKFPKFSFLYDSESSEFNIMRANVIIYGIINKSTIEMEVKSLHDYGQDKDDEIFLNSLKERIVDLPYYSEKGLKIYVPFLSRPLNEIYTNEPHKLLIEPYDNLIDNFQNSSIDPFDTYGPNLFNSFYTKLVKVGSNGREIAYFHYDTNTIYVVNEQGRLDMKIVLFDKYMRKISTNHILDRTKPVMEKYFASDRQGFIDELLKQKFISPKLYNIINKK